MPNTHNVALNIRSCRESRGYSQDYMAEMLNICQSSYANLELGKTSLSLERLIQIAGILGADIHTLIEDGDRTNDHLNGKTNSTESIAQVVSMHDQAIKELKNEIDILRKLVIEKQK